MATVLKQSGPTVAREGAGLANFNLDDLAESGKRHLVEAQAHAEQIIAAARQEAADIRQRATEAGRTDGLAAAQSEIAERIDQEVAQAIDARLPLLEETLKQFGQAETEWLQQWKAAVVKTALTLAEQLVRAELRVDTQVLQHWITEAIDLARAAKEVTVRLHPDSLARCSELLDRLVNETRVPLSFEVDSSIDPHGVVVTTEGGEIDAQLNTQLDRLRHQLGVVDDGERETS